MAEHYNDVITEERRSNWVRLRTLIALRWIAIAGQIATILAAIFLFGLNFSVGGFAIVIGASIILNIVTTSVFPENTRLTERGAALMFLFDITQLAALLYLSGGLNNPFALLILAPVSISASALRPKSAAFIGGVAIALVSVITIYHVPLETHAGQRLSMPDIFLFGQWAGIVIGVVFLGVFSWKIASETHTMSEALLATQMALGREQKLTDIGGVVAAAAHELGTPLATIKLVSSELVDELTAHPELMEDARLINEQADRCRDILHSMGQVGKDDLHMRFAPFQAVVEEAAQPHVRRGKSVVIAPQTEGPQPYVYRHPEIIHGLRNLIQNAVDFAQTTVWVDLCWTYGDIHLRITDDGYGFPASVIGRIGDPFVRQRQTEPTDSARPGYEGMGLGLFIAKTLLERTGAEMSFANGSDRQDSPHKTGKRSGAIVELHWPKAKICVPEGEQNKALGDNIAFQH